MTNPAQILTPADTQTKLDGTPFVHLDGSLHASFNTGDFATAAKLVAQVGEAAESMNHHPHMRLGYGRASFELSSHDAGGVTDRDLQLARRIQELAEGLGAEPFLGSLANYEIAIDCTDADAIRDFWRVGLDYKEAPADDGSIDLVDPKFRGPKVWFQHMGVARTERNRIHIDVYVPTADAESRVQEVVEAGGTLVTDEHAPDWWVLADVEGNEMCICTSSK
jgi:4a-hydroxytetrahydrobiopterin dehydratase